MKLLYCKKCGAIFNLRNYEKTCECGESKGHYIDNINAIYSGPCFPIGFNNMSLAGAVLNQPKSGAGKRFEAFVIPVECPTMKVE
jgi:hypothetical protein